MIADRDERIALQARPGPGPAAVSQCGQRTRWRAGDNQEASKAFNGDAYVRVAQSCMPS
jgi:hypothetical protein